MSEALAASQEQPRLNANLDTNFLKLVAIISMFCDHFGKTLLPQIWILPVIGRIAFPIFAYCLVVGCLYTSNIKRYLLRLGIFAVLSQPFYIAAFYPTWAGFTAQFWNLNIFFTLVVGLLAVYALKEKNWLLLVAMLLIGGLAPLDYGLYGIITMLLFYLMRQQSRGPAAFVVGLWLASTIIDPLLSGQLFEPVAAGTPMLFQGGALQAFSAFSLLLIYIDTNVRPRIPKLFFYAFYPAHLLLIFLLQLALH